MNTTLKLIHSGESERIEFKQSFDKEIIETVISLATTLFEAVEEVMLFILSHIKVAFEFTGELKRAEILEYPKPALRELVLNTIVHRDYLSPVDTQIKYSINQSPFSTQESYTVISS